LSQQPLLATQTTISRRMSRGNRPGKGKGISSTAEISYKRNRITPDEIMILINNFWTMMKGG